MRLTGRVRTGITSELSNQLLWIGLKNWAAPEW